MSANERLTIRDQTGVAAYRHEALAVVLQVRPTADEKLVLSVLGWRRTRDPYAGKWALPSGPVEVDETIGNSVRRHLARRVELSEVAHLEQLQTVSAPTRDPFQRTIGTAYLGLVPWTSDPDLPPEAAWLPVADLQPMAFDHEQLVEAGIARMRAKLSYTNLGFALAPPEFTMAQLRDAYEAALGREIAVTNLQRILTRRGQLEATGETTTPGVRGGRPAKLFRFTHQELAVTDPFAVLRPDA